MVEKLSKATVLAMVMTVVTAAACNSVLGNSDGRYVPDGTDGGVDGSAVTTQDGAVSPGTGFCGTAGTFFFCDDFDEGMGTSKWTSVDASPGSTIKTTGGFVSSSPSALQTVVAATGADAGVLVGGNVLLKLPLASLHQLDVDLHVERSPGGSASTTLVGLAFRDDTGVLKGSVGMVDGPGDQLSSFVQQGSGGTSLGLGVGPFAHAGFSHLKLEVALQGTDSASIAISFASGGSTYQGLTTVFVASNAYLSVGALGTSATWEVYADNVIVR